MTRANSISKFDNSLTEFLINALADKYGDAKSYAYRYNNLKVYMDPQKNPTPHFFVSIGISEACFAIADGKKLEGGLGVEDGYVKRWGERPNIQKELENHWKIIKEAIATEQEEEASKKSFAQARLKKAEYSNEELKVDMTGTGINKKDNHLQQQRRITLQELAEEQKQKIIDLNNNQD